MTDLSKLTAKDFSDAMHRGWRNREWCKNNWWEKADGSTAYKSRTAKCCCLIGAMAISLKAQPQHVYDALRILKLETWHVINSDAGNKHAAMKAVDAILLSPALPNTLNR